MSKNLFSASLLHRALAHTIRGKSKERRIQTMGATLEDSCSSEEGTSSGDVSMGDNMAESTENMKAPKRKNKKKNGKGRTKKKNTSNAVQNDKSIGGSLFKEDEKDEWMPSREMDFDEDDSYSSGFASCETTPSVCPFLSPKSPRRAYPVSHYKMQVSVSSPTSSPRNLPRKLSWP